MTDLRGRGEEIWSSGSSPTFFHCQGRKMEEIVLKGKPQRSLSIDWWTLIITLSGPNSHLNSIPDSGALAYVCGNTFLLSAALLKAKHTVFTDSTTLTPESGWGGKISQVKTLFKVQNHTRVSHRNAEKEIQAIRDRRRSYLNSQSQYEGWWGLNDKMV